MERLGDADRVLTGHRVEDEEGVVRLHDLGDLAHLLHQLGVDGEAAGGVDDQDVTPEPASFGEALLALPRQRRDERDLEARAHLALEAVGLSDLAAERADRLQHSELRFMEIARALMLRPSFLMLDEPAAGLSTEEIRRLGALIRSISRHGTGVLLVEHHADLIFDICDHVTVLNLGKVLAAGTPAEIRVHKEVVSAYLGG